MGYSKSGNQKKYLQARAAKKLEASKALKIERKETRYNQEEEGLVVSVALNNADCFEVSFDYNKEVVDVMRRFTNKSYDVNSKTWIIKVSCIEIIKEAFKALTFVKIKTSTIDSNKTVSIKSSYVSSNEFNEFDDNKIDMNELDKMLSNDSDSSHQAYGHM